MGFIIQYPQFRRSHNVVGPEKGFPGTISARSHFLETSSLNLVFPCLQEALKQAYLRTLTYFSAGLHYENQEFLGGMFVWRNVTATCAGKEDLDAEVQQLQASEPEPSSSIVESVGVDGGGSASVAVWVLLVIAIGALSSNPSAHKTFQKRSPEGEGGGAVVGHTLPYPLM